MTLTLKVDATWDLVVPTSMGVRLTPDAGQPVHIAHRFTMQATSAETNVASVPAALGGRVKVLTRFVAGSPVAAFIKADLAARGMTVDGPDVPQGGAWGLRHQFNIADSGMGSRGPRVHNDRAGEVGRTLDLADVDLDRLFAVEGVKVVHLSGLVAALSPATSRYCVALAQAARRHGTLVSFDLNHRASFWVDREDELRAAFTEIAELSDILVGNEEDFQLALGVAGPAAGGTGIEGHLAGFTEMLGRIHERFPRATLVATTLREVIDANRHLWGALVSSHGTVEVVPPREIGVLDRIGGGDGFVGGLLHGVLSGWEPRRCLEFGWASGALATTLLTDYALPADEAQVWSIWSGNARVQR